MISQLTARDRQLAEIGQPPIDVDPAREVLEREILDIADEIREHIREMQAKGFVPMVGKGQLFFRKGVERGRGSAA